MPRKAFPVLAFLLLVSVVSPAQSVVANIPLSGVPSGVAVSPLNNKIYAAVRDPSTGAPALAVIDGRTNAQVATVPLPAAFLVAVNIHTRRVYVAGCNFFQQFPAACTLSVIDGESNNLLTAIPVSSGAFIGVQGLAVNSATDRVYVSDADNSLIDVIDGRTNAIVNSISLDGQQPLGLAVDFVRNRVVAAINGPLIAVIDGRHNVVLQRIFVGADNANVAVNPVLKRAYVTNETFGPPSTLGVVDLEHFTVVANVPVGSNAFGVAADFASATVFVTDIFGQTIFVIDGRTNQVVANVAVFGRFIDVNPIRGLAYASDDFTQTIHVISER